jgi:putative phosphoribosyl transferase
VPRGGLPVAIEVAGALKAPLDVIVVRKLGVPWEPELAMGAIAGKARVLDHRLIRDLDIPDEEVEAVIVRETREMERREALYRGDLPAQDLRGRPVLIIDDGLATGATMVAAAWHVRSVHPQRLIVAVPVGSAEALSILRGEVDECVCLATPEPFFAVGEWYTDFRRVNDSEVRDTLKHAQHLAQRRGSSR